jgi:hypothetical protein
LTAVGYSPPPGDVVNLAVSDVSTDAGQVGPGNYTATHASDDVREILTEMQTSGNPAKRLSLLDHVWAFDVAPANNYVFEVEAHHTPNNEGDDFRFTYSLDDVSWLPLLTVSKTQDDGGIQNFVFPVDVAGPMYVRVEDADRTPGHRVQDVLSVDRLAIVSDRTKPDTTPPPPCDGLEAQPGDALVSLDWEASDSADVAGYVVERATGNGAFAPLTAQPVLATSHEDAAVSNMTLYRYRVRTVDASGNEGAPSGEVSAVPHAGAGPIFMRVASIVVGTQTVVSGWKQARARVTIRDEAGGPVAGALVTVTFGGMYHETLSATTGSDGVALVLTNQAEKGKVKASACVAGVSHPTKFYMSQDNAQTCDDG